MSKVKIMEQLTFTQTEEGLHIEGFPDAEKLVTLKGGLAQRISDLSLHRDDLEFACQCLDAINDVGENYIIRWALWRSAIVFVMKCFGNSKARKARLDPMKILNDESDIAMEVFEYFKNLRNKHIVHDENPFSQSIPGAIINRDYMPRKIEKITCFGITQDTLNQQSFSNLKLLAEKSRKWVVSEFDRCCDAAMKELESRSRNELLAMPQLTLSASGVEDNVKTRKLGA